MRKPGETYGALRILEALGQGGFAKVYKVAAPGVERPLALKVSMEPVGSPDEAQRILREVMVLRKLSNPYVVRVHDAGIDRDGFAYILMDLAEGWSLETFHDFDRPVRYDYAANVIWQVCQGLAEAHDLGIVHRDIKPANILLDAQLHVTVVDFGFARSWNEHTVVGRGPTVANMLVGTPHYAQPEQLMTQQLTPAADVYSLALVAYELLTGQTPFVREGTVGQVREMWSENVIAWLQAHAQTAVIPIAERPVGQYVPAELRRAIERALSKNPAERQANARELGDTIHAATWGNEASLLTNRGGT